MNDLTAIRLNDSIRLLATMTQQQINLAKAALQQTYTMPDLQDRYHGYSEADLKVLLIECGGWPAITGPGRKITVALDYVLKLDALINGRIQLVSHVA